MVGTKESGMESRRKGSIWGGLVVWGEGLARERRRGHIGEIN